MQTQIPPTLDRNLWRDHPNYPSQVLLLGSHANFRRINTYLIDQVRGGSDLYLAGSLYRQWIRAMRSHEAYEEHKLYPYLARRWGADMTAAEAGHQELHTAYDAVIAAFEDEDREQAVAALSHHNDVLTAHLALEEELVIPLLLALSPEEFRTFTR